MSYELFIALKYLRLHHKTKFISLISLISILGIAIGVMAVIVVMSVMNGFDKHLRSKMLGIKSHIVISDTEIKEYPQIIDKVKNVSHVLGCSPVIVGQAMIKYQNDAMGIMIKGIDPSTEKNTTDISKYIIKGSMKLSEGDYNIVLGKELARNLGVSLHEEVTVISPEYKIGPGGAAIPKTARLKVIGLFECGIYEYDNTLAYISLDTAKKLYNLKGVNRIEIKLDNIYLSSQVSGEIKELLEYRFLVRDWQTLDRAFFFALKLEKITMFIILGLIIVVAAFNIVSTLIMIILEKTKDIGILKSIGANLKSIRKIFILEGTIIGVMGTILGCICGIGLCLLLKRYQFIHLPPEVYYLRTLPVDMRIMDFSAVCAASILISFLSTLYPARQASKLDPVEALRYE